MKSMQNILIKKNPNINVFNESLQKSKLILAVNSYDGIDKCLNEEIKIVFVLFGDILSVASITEKLKNAGKMVLVHLDLIEGLNSHNTAVDYIAANTEADGILSTKSNLVKHAKSCGLLAIQRFFVLDSMALHNIEKHLPLDYADAIEVLPGLMPKVIKRLVKMTDKPIIAGGLISDREDIDSALNAGASAVSTSRLELLR